MSHVSPEEGHKILYTDYTLRADQQQRIVYVNTPQPRKPVPYDFTRDDLDGPGSVFIDAWNEFYLDPAKREPVTEAIRDLARLAGLL